MTLFHRGRREPPLTAGARHVHGDFAELAAHVAELADGEPEVVIDVSPGLGKGGHGVLHFAGIAKRGLVLTSLDVYRAMEVLWGGEGAGPLQSMPVREEAELRTQPSPDLNADLFDNVAVECAVDAHEPQFPVTILRCPVIYGPLDTQRRLRNYVRQMADGRTAILLDSRLARLRLTRGYVENVAQAVVAAASDHRAAGRTYNAGEPDALTEADWVRAIGAQFGWDGEVVVADPATLPTELRVPLPAQDIVADTSRLRAELGFAERVDRDEGLRLAVEWELARQRHEPPRDYTVEDAALRLLPSAAATPRDLPRSG